MYFPQIGKAHCPDYRQRQRLPVVSLKMAITRRDFKPNRRRSPAFPLACEARPFMR